MAGVRAGGLDKYAPVLNITCFTGTKVQILTPERLRGRLTTREQEREPELEEKEEYDVEEKE